MAENTFLTQTEITIQDFNSNKPVLFSNLTLNESFINVNHFSFSVKPLDNKSSLDSIINFKKSVLGKAVELTFKDGSGNKKHQFKGIVLEVNSSLIDNLYYEFYITGSGNFGKVNEIAECHSFYKSSLDDIISKAFSNSGLKNDVKKDPQTTKQHHYIVQYEQSLFSFMSSLAIRFGEWMYYDGEKLQFGKKPSGSAIELKAPAEVTNLNIRAHITKKPEQATATDIFKSEIIKSKSKENAPDNPIIKAAEDAGEHFYENPGKSIFLASGFRQEDNDDKYKLEQEAINASSVFITGNTMNNSLSVGKIIKIKDSQDTAGKSFIVTQIQHYVGINSSYSNTFTAVPLEVTVPYYTNPKLTPKATPQAAIITDNEDDSGLARVKVKFAWMADDEKTPWISVSVPHAGKDKGFRFLPEKDDEVIVDFWDNNAEMPFVSGSLYTEKNKSGIPEKGNNIKVIGSKTGRQLVIDDDAGKLQLVDNYPGKRPANGLNFWRDKEHDCIFLGSFKTDDIYSVIVIGENKESASFDGIKICVADPSDNEELAEITLERKKKIKINTKGNIDIHADGTLSLSATTIKMKAQDIEMKADKDIKVEATAKLESKALSIKIEADTTLEAKGNASAKVEGAMLDLKGSGITSLSGSLVKIN